MINVLLFIPNKNFDQVGFSVLRNSAVQNRLNLFIVSDSNNIASGSRGMKIQPDVNYFNVNSVNFDGLIVIGCENGMEDHGNSVLERIIKKFDLREKFIFTIKSGSVIFANSTKLKGEISSSEFCKKFYVRTGFSPVDSDIVSSGNIFSTRTDTAINDTLKMIFADRIIIK